LTLNHYIPNFLASALTWFTIGGYEVRSHDLWIVATACACSIACGVLGCFLVLRRMSLLGDAISHAILPGLALAFIVTGSREPPAMLTGALAMGVLTAVLSSVLTRWGRVQEDAAMGVVFTSLFAIGILLITFVARDIDLDPGCVLYGLIELSPFHTVSILGLQLPHSFVWVGAIMCINITLIVVFYKELKIVCFDPYLATTMGISAVLVHYALMTAVASTAVASFEAVGSILVVAMLVAPGATAHLLTDRLSHMLYWAAALAALSAIIGYIGAVAMNTSVAGMIATTALALFMLAALFAPKHGYLTRQLRQLFLSLRIAREDMLGIAYRWHEQALPNITLQTNSLSAPPPHPLTYDQLLDAASATGLSHILSRLALFSLVFNKLLTRLPSGDFLPSQLALTRARSLVRGHRLWESYLAKHLDLDPTRLHSKAHRAEHYLSPEIQGRLSASQASPTDPHGKPIPPL